MSADNDPVVELEIKVVYAEQRVADLDATVVEQARRLTELEEEVRVLREALRRLAGQRGSGADVLGAYDSDDPVPRSG